MCQSGYRCVHVWASGMLTVDVVVATVAMVGSWCQQEVGWAARWWALSMLDHRSRCGHRGGRVRGCRVGHGEGGVPVDWPDGKHCERLRRAAGRTVMVGVASRDDSGGGWVPAASAAGKVATVPATVACPAFPVALGAIVTAVLVTAFGLAALPAGAIAGSVQYWCSAMVEVSAGVFLACSSAR